MTMLETATELETAIDPIDPRGVSGGLVGG